MTTTSSSKSWYLMFLILLSGLGGLVAGIDYGIISVALLYLDKTIPMTPAEQGFMVSIYVFGGVIASLLAGASADMLGRKKMLVVSGVMFVASILLIYVARATCPCWSAVCSWACPAALSVLSCR
jgi:MFS family permease